MNTTKLPMEPYLLGCLIGDGGLHGNLTFASKDQDIIDRINTGLVEYKYFLKQQYPDSQKRACEYRIAPIVSNNCKYEYYFRGVKYTASELLKVLQEAGYPITNHDTLHSVLGINTKTKRSFLHKYFPKLKDELTCIKLKDTQNSEFIGILNALNLRCKSTEKRIPEIYFEASFEARLLLFQGLMDTDGCGSGHRLEFCVANEGLADDFARLAVSLGYTFKKHIKQPKYFNEKYQEYRYGKTAYRIMLNNITTIKPFLCKRKLENYQKNERRGEKHGTITCSAI